MDFLEISHYKHLKNSLLSKLTVVLITRRGEESINKTQSDLSICQIRALYLIFYSRMFDSKVGQFYKYVYVIISICVILHLSSDNSSKNPQFVHLCI